MSNTLQNCILTIGTFDGVHKGHQYLFSKMKELSLHYKTKSIVITYNRHPIETLNNSIFPYLLNDKEQKEALIKASGIDEIVFLDFSEEIARQSAEDFLKDTIIKLYKPSWIVCGYDTHFGHNREGNSKFLQSHSHKYQYQIYEVDALSYNQDIIISSSLIRDLIRKGFVDNVLTYLGYYYSIKGIVITGKKIGRTLGFPTINLLPKDKFKLIPDSGVYLTLTNIEGNLIFGLTNIGVSPSIKSDNKVEIETHLLNFSGDLYSKEVQLYFLEKIRNERKFAQKSQLITQIEKDIQYAQNFIMSFNKWEYIK